MEFEPRNFFPTLFKNLNDKSKCSESHKMLEVFNRNLIEEQIDSALIDACMPHFFHTKNSLLKFIDEASKTKDFKKACELAVVIIYTVLNNFYNRVQEKDIFALYKVASRIFKSKDTDSSIKVKIFNSVLLSLEKDNGEYDATVLPVYRELLDAVLFSSRLRKTGDQVRGKELELLGYMMYKFPYIVDDHIKMKIKECMMFNFDKESPLILRKVSHNIVQGIFTGFMYYLESAPFNLEKTEDKKAVTNMYKTLKHLVVLKDRTKTGNRAAMKFLGANTFLFKEELVKEHQFWHEKLLLWLACGAEEQKVGLTTLKAIFQSISKSAEDCNDATCVPIIQYFLNYCKTVLNTKEASTLEKRLSVFCLRVFSQSFHKHLNPPEVKDLFLFIMQVFEKTFVQDYKEDNDEWDYLPDYIQTIANFMRFKQFAASEFFCLQRGAISMIKSFHRLPILQHYIVTDALLLTIFYLKNTQYFDTFIENIVYQGVVWCCSHQHTSFEAFSEDSTQKIITVKNYYPLWINVLKVYSYKHYDKYEFYMQDRKYVLERIIQELVKTLMILVNKLNVSVKLKDEDSALTDLEKIYQLEERNDYSIFLNVVDFYKFIFDNVAADHVKNSICKMVDHLVAKCLKHPLNSGFYKLLSYCLKISRQLSLFDGSSDSQDVINCKETLMTFLPVLLHKMVEFKDDLLISSLQVLLETPVSIITHTLPLCVTPFVNVFEVGRSYLPLAEMGVETLEHWQKTLPVEDFEQFLGKIISSLDSFLRSKSLKGYSSQPVQKRRKTMQALKKRKVLEETEPELVKLQRKILSFIGRQSFKTCQNFVFSDSTFVKNLIGGQSAYLKVSLPYDIQLDVYLDTFLPRIIDLALYSSDRKTRITSCELLQACAMVFLGRAKQMSTAGLEELNDMLKTIATPLLLLSCDIDQVVRQIFQPLFLQIVHWYTSPKARGQHTSIIIDTLLEGITHPTNSNLKDFSGKCLSEFVKWTIKHENLDPTPSIKVLIKNMRFFSSHPDPIKKLGAALIFNSTYRELREEERIVNVFWLEILHIFVLSLDGVLDHEETTTVVQLKRALAHLQRVIMEKPGIFRKEDKKRRVPNDLGTGVLTDVSIWLLNQTGSRSIHCREACMGLFVNMAPLSNANKINLHEFIVEHLDTTVANLYDVKVVKFSSLREQSYCDCANFLNYLRNLLCCLDGYKFIVKNNLETVNFDEGVFSETHEFLEKLQTADLSTCLSLIARKSWTFTTLDKDMFLTLKSACILSILKLYNAIVHNEPLCRKSNSIWTKEFYKLVAYLVLTPQELGLVNLINTEYTEILVILLNTLPSKLPKASVAVLKSTLMDIIQNYSYSSIDLEKNMSLKQRNLLKGVVLLHSTTIGQGMQLTPHANSLVETYFSNFGQKASDGTIFINHLQDTALNYTVGLLKFVLTENNSAKKLIDPVHSDLYVQSVDMGKKLPFGLYFFNTFAEAVIPAVVRDFETFLKLSLDKNDIKLTVDIIMLVLRNVIKDKQYKQSFNEIANCLLTFWSRFADYFSVSKENMTLGMEFLTLFVQICDSGSSDMQDWLVDCMMREKGVDCIEIFELLAKITRSDVSEEQSSSLKTMLMVLNEKIESQSSNQEIVTNSFNKLLTFFPVVKSPIIFEHLTEIYVKIPPSVDINTLLRKFMYQLDTDVHPSFLEHIYTMVLKKRRHWYKIAKDILPVVFQICNIDSFEQFFVNNIKNMLAILEANNLEESIVIFILVEILFLRVAIGTEERKDCAICAASEEPKLLGKLLSFTFKAFKVTDTQEDILRRYKCHAYNATASIISNSLKKEVFYKKLFKREGDNNEDILWHAIINTSINYDFPKNFDSLPTQKKILVNIRDELRKSRHNADNMSKSLHYIESQRLFNSSLSEDVTKFDFTNSVLRSESAGMKKMQENRRFQVELFLDATEINEHECMGTVCSVIQHMFDTGVCQMPFDDEENIALPEWMKGLRSMLLSDTTHKNVKIFLVKVIDNMIHIFNRYAKFFLEPLIKFIVDLCAGSTINYFVTDMLVIISKWASMIPNLTDQEAVLASRLLEFLIKNLERDRQDVFKYNIELLKLITEAWKKHLRVPAQIIEDFFSTEDTTEIGIYVSSVLLVNGLEPWERGEEHRFLELMLKPLKSSERRIYRACAETLGPTLNVLKAEEYVERVSDFLKNMWPIDKYVSCLEGIAIKYPLIVDTYHVVRIISTLNQTKTDDRPICLKILLKRLEVSLDILDQVTDFQIINWNEHIDDSNLDIQILSLELIKRCLTHFVTYPGFEKVVTTLARNIYHPNAVFRSCLFDVAIAMYNTNSDHTNTCKSILTLGLVDPDIDNQKKIFDFWEANGVLPQKIIDRFSFLLSELYKSKIEDKLLGLSSYFLVNMLAASEKYDAMIFEHPLEDCNFEDYDLETNWKLQHPSVVPMFAETLDVNTLGSTTFSGDRDIFALRQTQSTFQFAPTQSFHDQQLSTYTSLQSTLGIDLDTNFKNPNTVNISQKYRVNRRRFLKNTSKISYMMANYETQKKITTDKKRKEAAIEREKKVTIYRSYRKGDFPDVQISLSALLKPLQALALHDSEMSKILFLEIFKGIANKIENNLRFLSSVSDSIKNIFQSSVSFNRYLFAALLDILLKNKDNMVFDPKLISYVAQESGLASTGALLIEEYLISGVGDDMPSTSKRKFREDDWETVSWIKLAELYKELEEWDTVRAIFLEKMDCKRDLQKAITYESKYFYKDAADLYKKLISSDESHNRRDFYYDAYFKCFANLGQWETIPNAVATVVGTEDTWKSLWEDEWSQQKLLPWYITSHVKNQLFTQETDEEFLTNLNSCLSDAKSEEYLNNHFSEELCMLWLCEKDMQTAKHYLRIAEKNFLEDWQVLNPMFQSQRFQKLLKLQNIVEISDFIEIFKSIDDIDGVLKTLKNRWSSIPIEASPSLILSETKSLYRKQFITNILDKLSTVSGFNTRPYKKELCKLKVAMDIDLITTASESGNFHMTKKYFEFYKNKEHPKLNVAKGVLCLQTSKMIQNAVGLLDEKLKYHTDAVKHFRDNLKRPEDESIKLTTNNKLFDVLIEMSELMSRDKSLLTVCELLSSVLSISFNTIADIETYAWNTLKCSVEKCTIEEMDSEMDRNDSSDKFKKVADTYIKLAHFIRNKNDSALEGEFTLFVLRAMKLNSSEARQLFPCILMQENLATTHKELFLRETEQIPTWMFLGWIPQLLVNVDSPKLFAVSKLIQRIADTYPQAIMYPYRLSKDNYNFSDDSVRNEAKRLIKRLDGQLLKDEKINKFLEALSYVSIPENIISYNVIKIKDSGDINNIQKYIQSIQEDLFNQVYGTNNVNNMQGNMFKSIRRFENILSRMSDMPINEIKSYAITILQELRKISKTKPSQLLKDYCPWLANFSANKLNMELEIPGQYDGQKLPVPQHHVKISGFHPEVVVMSSKQKPIKVRMIGMDTKEYPFLIKFGEDIRQDQRIQQLFCLMNNILRNDTSCSNNGLDILTYQVIPLNSSLGLIQWVNDIQSLNKFISNSLKNISQLGALVEEYDNFMSKGVKSYKENDHFNNYGKAAAAIRKDRVVQNYNGLVMKVPSDVMRTSFWTLSTNTENYIALRNNFIKTYSVMCAAHWILGIGDRHLENSSICLQNGKVLGIDFGLSFGTATQIQPVPELVPFRLTPHIVSLMEPLKERGPFREYMIHCLKCLRANSSSLLATMNVFIQEPSIDWLEHAEAGEDCQSNTWYPLVKLEQAKRKLEGANSVDIMVEELKAGMRVQQYTDAYVKLVLGEENENLRTMFVGKVSLTVEDQVDCLIDHATDSNLLGRMWRGWCPWV